MIQVACTNCKHPYPDEGIPYRCDECGGLYDYITPLEYHPQQVDPGAPGIWRYRHSFGLPADYPPVSLGEGQTPLIWTEAFGKELAIKCEFLNPTGSFKDRGSALLVSFVRGRGAASASEDSSGNAGASFAAYAARAGLRTQIFIPDTTSGPKRAQIEAYGAELKRIMGPRSNAAEAVRRAADQGAVYASHAYLPFNLPGYATAAYEILDQMQGEPGAVVLPAGQGGLLLGIYRGFEALHRAGLVQQVPQMVGVQARACAPLWALASFGPAGLGWASEGETQAEGIRILHPLRGDAVLAAVAESGGRWVAVDEEDILPRRDQLARRGFYVEPTSAVVWGALAQVADQLREPIVAVLTGSGFKTH